MHAGINFTILMPVPVRARIDHKQSDAHCSVRAHHGYTPMDFVLVLRIYASPPSCEVSGSGTVVGAGS